MKALSKVCLSVVGVLQVLYQFCCFSLCVAVPLHDSIVHVQVRIHPTYSNPSVHRQPYAVRVLGIHHLCMAMVLVIHVIHVHVHVGP